MKLAFVDCETTGLDHRVHEVFEIAVVVRAEGLAETEHHWWLQADLSKADPGALRVNRLYERDQEIRNVSDSREVAKALAIATSNASIVGAVPSFDISFLDPLLRRHKFVPAWHYQPICIEALIAGKLGILPPWNSNELSRAVGVEPKDFARHTAMGDVRWVMAMWDAVYAK